MLLARHIKLAILAGVLFLSHHVGGQLTSTGCGTSKGCFQNPTGCSPNSATCQFVSWIYDSTGKVFTIEVSGAAANKYVAVAFTEDNGMSNGDGYICTGDQRLVSTSISSPTEPVDDAALPTGVSLVKASSNNGKVQCTFKRPETVIKTILGTKKTFSLASKSFYLLVASGNTKAAGGKSVTTYHTTRIKSLPTSFITTQGSKSAGVSGLVKAHGALMILAWLMLVNIGGIVARHFKPTWPGVQVAGKDIWFQIHRFAMVTAVLATLIAFIIIFVSVNGWVGEQALSHGVIGVVVTILALINPIMATFRPHPGTSNRYIFNWAHWFVGSCARVLALANLFLGVALQKVVKLKWTTWVLVAFVVVHVLFELLFELLTWRGKPEEIAHENINMGDSEPPKKQPEKLSGAKTGLLVLYILGNVGLTICMFVAVGRL